MHLPTLSTFCAARLSEGTKDRWRGGAAESVYKLIYVNSAGSVIVWGSHAPPYYWSHGFVLWHSHHDWQQHHSKPGFIPTVSVSHILCRIRFLWLGKMEFSYEKLVSYLDGGISAVCVTMCVEMPLMGTEYLI